MNSMWLLPLLENLHDLLQPQGFLRPDHKCPTERDFEHWDELILERQFQLKPKTNVNACKQLKNNFLSF